jgi:outer membrane murein-binding lipoprotein Lpp
MYKKFASLLIALALLALAGCKKDAQINAVLADFDSFTAELVKKVDAQPTAAGVDAAQKYLDSRKEELKGKWDSIKGARGFQVSDETKKKMADSIVKNYTTVSGLQIKYMGKSMNDPAFKSKLDKLVKDYQDLYEM